MPFTVEVTAPGFEAWRSDDAAEVPEHHITLDPQERRRLAITLTSAVP
jgi:hypothetical protein